MAKFTYKEIKEIIKDTPAELKGQDFFKIAHNKYGEIGFYRKTSANWWYNVRAIVFNGEPKLVVVVFGRIQ